MILLPPATARDTPISRNAFMNSRPTCEPHGNPMAGGRIDYPAAPGSTGGVSVKGQAFMSFTGCACRELVPVK